MNSKIPPAARASTTWKHSIQTKMTAVVLVMMALILTVNVFIFRQITAMVRRIDSVFASNVSIAELSDRLDTNTTGSGVFNIRLSFFTISNIARRAASTLSP